MPSPAWQRREENPLVRQGGPAEREGGSAGLEGTGQAVKYVQNLGSWVMYSVFRLLWIVVRGVILWFFDVA